MNYFKSYTQLKTLSKKNKEIIITESDTKNALINFTYEIKEVKYNLTYNFKSDDLYTNIIFNDISYKLKIFKNRHDIDNKVKEIIRNPNQFLTQINNEYNKNIFKFITENYENYLSNEFDRLSLIGQAHICNNYVLLNIEFDDNSIKDIKFIIDILNDDLSKNNIIVNSSLIAFSKRAESGGSIKFIFNYKPMCSSLNIDTSNTYIKNNTKFNLNKYEETF